MTVKELALAACSPNEVTVCMCGASYSLISDYTGQIDCVMLDLLGDYIVADFKANKPDEYCIWVKEVPVKKEGL